MPKRRLFVCFPAEDRIVPGVGSVQETRSPARPARTALNAPGEGVSADAATLSGNLATQEGVASTTSVDISQLSSTGVQQSTAPGATWFLLTFTFSPTVTMTLKCTWCGRLRLTVCFTYSISVPKVQFKWKIIH